MFVYTTYANTQYEKSYIKRHLSNTQFSITLKHVKGEAKAS